MTYEKKVNFKPQETDGEEGHGLLLSLLYLDKYQFRGVERLNLTENDILDSIT